MSCVTKTIVLRSSLAGAGTRPAALRGDRIERAERLVHQHHRRIGGERARDADALLLAAGELARIAIAIPRGSMSTSASSASTRRAIRARPIRAACGTVATFPRSSCAGTGPTCWIT
jgi:hypothetical protein